MRLGGRALLGGGKGELEPPMLLPLPNQCGSDSFHRNLGAISLKSGKINMAGGNPPIWGYPPHLIPRRPCPSDVTWWWGGCDRTPGGSSEAGGAVGDRGLRDVLKSWGSTPEYRDVTQSSWDGTPQFGGMGPHSLGGL